MQAADPLREAEEYFHRAIPLTRAMGVRVVADSAQGFTVEAPVALNYNHLHTAFGGSINAVATLAGYGFLWLEVRETAAQVLIAESSIRFVRPVHELISARCVPPDGENLREFRERLRTTGKARISLRVEVEENGKLAAELTGTFVAVDPSPATQQSPPS